MAGSLGLFALSQAERAKRKSPMANDANKKYQLTRSSRLGCFLFLTARKNCKAKSFR
jgi:hypothetical protein